MSDIKIAGIATYISITLLFFMWTIHLFQIGTDINLYQYGIYPMHAKGLVGILAAPFLHDTENFGHIINNSIPAFILTWLLFYHYRKIATPAFISIYLLTGISMWLLARPSFHIGMSGVIYGLAAFLVTAGFFRKNMRVAAVSLFVIFMYGSMIWGIFPGAVNVSWEGHTLGLFAGIIIAVITKNTGPQPQKLLYEIEEEMGIEPEHSYWLPESEQSNNSENNVNQDFVITYEYKSNSDENSTS